MILQLNTVIQYELDMYRKFFGLNQLPFKISPDLKFFYKQASREDLANALLYSLARGDGILKVVGEVGAGKTTLLRLLSSKLPNTYKQVYISSPNLSAADFLKLICTELEIGVAEKASKHDVLRALQDYLISEHGLGNFVVLLVDEAQSMTIDTLEEIRLLGNLETETDKLLQIVLCGQPELDRTLEDERIRPLKDRIAMEVEIPFLNAEEVLRYLNYRMRIAGNVNEDVFNLSAAKRIQKLSSGLPRKINLIADKLLMSAFSSGDKFIKTRHFDSLGHEFSSKRSRILGFKPVWYTLSFVILAGAVVAWYLNGNAPFSLKSLAEPTKTAEISNKQITPQPKQESLVPDTEPKTEVALGEISPTAPAPLKEEEVVKPVTLESTDIEIYRSAYDLMKKRKYEAAIVNFSRVVDSYPDSSLADNSLYWIGEINMLLDRGDQGLKYFERVILDYPESSKVPSSLLRYGDAFARSGNKKMALMQYKKLTESYPRTKEAEAAQKRIDERFD